MDKPCLLHKAKSWLLQALLLLLLMAPPHSLPFARPSLRDPSVKIDLAGREQSITAPSRILGCMMIPLLLTFEHRYLYTVNSGCRRLEGSMGRTCFVLVACTSNNTGHRSTQIMTIRAPTSTTCHSSSSLCLLCTITRRLTQALCVEPTTCYLSVALSRTAYNSQSCSVVS